MLARRAASKIDVFDARAEVRDETGSERSCAQQLGVESVGDRRHQCIEFLQRFRERLSIEGQIVRVFRHIVIIAQTLMHPIGQAPCDQQTRPLRFKIAGASIIQ